MPIYVGLLFALLTLAGLLTLYLLRHVLLIEQLPPSVYVPEQSGASNAPVTTPA